MIQSGPEPYGYFIKGRRELTDSGNPESQRSADLNIKKETQNLKDTQKLKNSQKLLDSKTIKISKMILEVDNQGVFKPVVNEKFENNGHLKIFIEQAASKIDLHAATSLNVLFYRVVKMSYFG